MGMAQGCIRLWGHRITWAHRHRMDRRTWAHRQHHSRADRLEVTELVAVAVVVMASQ